MVKELIHFYEIDFFLINMYKRFKAVCKKENGECGMGTGNRNENIILARKVFVLFQNSILNMRMAIFI